MNHREGCCSFPSLLPPPRCSSYHHLHHHLHSKCLFLLFEPLNQLHHLHHILLGIDLSHIQKRFDLEQLHHHLLHYLHRHNMLLMQ